MKFSKNNSLKIILIGAGGTGGYIAPHLYRIAYASGRKVQIIIADGDIVEKKNLIRQNFADCDIGKNKAQVLAERYAGAFGIKANYIPDFIESKFMLEELTSSAAFNGPQTILIGAVVIIVHVRCVMRFFKNQEISYILIQVTENIRDRLYAEYERTVVL